MEDFREERFKKRLKESIQQSKEGKARIISSKELDKLYQMFIDLIKEGKK